MIGALVACGDSGTVGEGFSFDFVISRGDQTVPCASIPGVDRVEVRLLTSDGTTTRAGFPQEADCANGRFDIASAPAGTHLLDVSARGRVAGGEESVLFRARTEVTLPSPAPLSLSLEPEVAFLSLDWAFGADGLAPCGLEVDTIDVVIAAQGSQQAAFLGTFGCTERPVVIEQPFDLQEYTIDLKANSFDGFPLFAHNQRRVLEPGDNEYLATLSTRGGRLLLDWEFSVMGSATRLCDDPRIGVTQLQARVSSPDGDVPIMETIDCAEPRPYSVRTRRYLPGRQLQLELSAEGQERFYAQRAFMMPAGDWESGVLTLEAVGTATIAVQVVTATCTATVDQYEYSIALDGSPDSPILEGVINPPEMSEWVQNLPYGDYQVQVTQRVGNDALCTADALRSITGRDNLWDAFLF